MITLRSQQLDRRIEKAEGAFRRLGTVEVARQKGTPQTIVITVTHPGWGALTTARLFCVETWVLRYALWHLVKYAYDLMMKPGPARYGFHWHDGGYHTHCIDPAYPDRDHHYPGGPIDLFDAFDRFADFLDGKTPMTCAGLRPVQAVQ